MTITNCEQQRIASDIINAIHLLNNLIMKAAKNNMAVELDVFRSYLYPSVDLRLLTHNVFAVKPN